MRFYKKIVCFLALALYGQITQAEVMHPRVLLNNEDVAAMKIAAEKYPLFKESFEQRKASVDAKIGKVIDVPLPKDPGGGYTHEQHKKNYTLVRDAGILYLLTDDKRYAELVRDVLFLYAKMYPTLGEHPAKKEEAPGKLFWQSLNEAVWLVHVSQAYDAVYGALSAGERAFIEKDLLRPVATYLSDESPKTFNRIHNHGTWAAAAVGMTGYAIGDNEFVEKALLGLDKSGKSGFLKQLEQLFSPDGYYTEGPYYQRYALMPFILFGYAIEKNDPQRHIFDYRDGILLKAVYTTVDLSYKGLFFPLNDAIKDKGLSTPELGYGLAIAYSITQDPTLLSLASYQLSMDLSPGGALMAKGIDENLGKPFNFRSVDLRDGANGDEGALHILRSGAKENDQALVVKNTSQGMVHGHFDKLTWLFYDNGKEVVSDYGASRFLNVEAKYGGHYLRENDLWAKQTIAHNTLVVDERSHFDGVLAVAEAHHPSELVYVDDEKVKLSSAKMDGAYDDVSFRRTMAMLTLDDLEYPVVLDLMDVNSSKQHQYDLPVFYQGHLMETNFAYDASKTSMAPLGKKNGYQYLWRKASAKLDNQLSQITWLLGNRFYSYSSLVNKDTEVVFTELGANDPDFNLRRESGFIFRTKKAKDHTFLSVLEPHGEYNPALEYTTNSHSLIKSLAHHHENGIDLVEIVTKNNKKWLFAVNLSAGKNVTTEFTHDGQVLSWTGVYYLKGYDL